MYLYFQKNITLLSNQIIKISQMGHNTTFKEKTQTS